MLGYTQNEKNYDKIGMDEIWETLYSSKIILLGHVVRCGRKEGG